MWKGLTEECFQREIVGEFGKLSGPGGGVCKGVDSEWGFACSLGKICSVKAESLAFIPSIMSPTPKRELWVRWFLLVKDTPPEKWGCGNPSWGKEPGRGRNSICYACILIDLKEAAELIG